jgi:hypothetical protein
MSDQVFNELESQDSHAAGGEAWFDSGEDDAVSFQPAGIPRTEVADAATSCDADVDAAYDESGGEQPR